MQLEDGYVEVPVMLGFDKDKVIGSLKVKVEELPKTTNYVFTIGYKELGDNGHSLFGVSLLSDEEYSKYLIWEAAGKPE